MTRLPGAIFIVDILREKIAVKEAQKLNIPIFAMVDTNSDPRGIDYVIPANDDASKSISKILEHVGSNLYHITLWCFGVAPGRPPAPPDRPNPTPRPPIEKVSIFDQNVDLALTLAMGTFTENPCARMTIL